MRKLILIGLILMIVPLALADESWNFHMDNGSFIVNASNLYNFKTCVYYTSQGLVCNSTGGSSNVTDTDTHWTIDNDCLENQSNILTFDETQLNNTIDARDTNTQLSEAQVDTYVSNNGYLTSETDPIYSAWDKSTGISITESQISDLQNYYLSSNPSNYITDGNTNWDNSYGFYNSESQLTALLDDNYHKTGENLVVGN